MAKRKLNLGHRLNGPRFEVGQRVKINYLIPRQGTIAKVEYLVSGYVYVVDVDDVGAKIVNSVMMEPA